ncbi:hypothetical protein K7432_008346 [Basidiobolus ranarum]|uniref:NADH-ubiquinone oxidoreductase 21 kDa subunit n=1 Tax=Basidiobolus ranarum TaxID=34480 RepID=A0ABR2VYR3_9FUNG
MPEVAIETPYPVIDTDPHFFRVVRYFRLEDYALLAAGTAAFPGAMHLMEYIHPTGSRMSPTLWKNAMRSSIFFGAVGSFLLAYQNSSFRFWGWRENEREVRKDFIEMRKRANEGKPLYGESNLNDYSQRVAAQNSRYSALKFAAVPFFNFANHNYHGVDTDKYYKGVDRNKDLE